MDFKEAIALNKKKRINWSPVLGESLNRFVAKHAAMGLGKDYIVSLIKRHCAGKDLMLGEEELNSRIEIGVTARLAEMSTELKGFKKGLMNLGKYRAVVRVLADGSKYIFLSPQLELSPGQLVEVEITKIDGGIKDGTKES